MCECWRHTATYLTYWLCVKSHPLDIAARCVALVIYSRASTPTLPCCGLECLINAVSTGSFFCQLSLPSAKSNTMHYCFGKTQEDWELKIYGEEPEPKSTFFVFFSVVFLMSRSTSREQNLRAVNRLCAQNVTGLNPACDLCWMSYPRCIQSFQWLCCWVLHLGIHGIKMHACIGLGSISAYYQYWVIRPCGRLDFGVDVTWVLSFWSHAVAEKQQGRKLRGLGLWA